MDLETLGVIGLLVMFILMFLRVPISISMAVPALIGIVYVKNWKALSAGVGSIVWDHSYSYILSTIPMFVLMGELLTASGISEELFATFRSWFGKLRGGLAMATIGASALFGAASGSSLATTGTMGAISAKEMLKSGYDKAFTGGSIVAGGTLAILIPPSTMFIIYGMLTEQSIGKLLVAGIIPGILLTFLYIITVFVSVLVNPSIATKDEGVSWKERIYSLRNTIWILLLFIVVIGGMYKGLFTPTEAAGIGAFGAFVIALVRRKLTWKNMGESLSRTLKTTAFLFAIILSAFMLNYFLVLTKVPMVLAGFLSDTGLPAWAIFMLIVVLYILLGAVMDSMAMIVVTIPIILPIIQELGFDLIWFGVIIVVVVEMAFITPPIGMNCFVLNGVAPDLRLEEIFKGALRFTIPIVTLILLLYLFPQIATYLPTTMK